MREVELHPRDWRETSGRFRQGWGEGEEGGRGEAMKLLQEG